MAGGLSKARLRTGFFIGQFHIFRTNAKDLGGLVNLWDGATQVVQYRNTNAKWYYCCFEEVRGTMKTLSN
jgi:hypothetical protein